MEAIKTFLREDFLSVQAPVLLLFTGFIYFVVTAIRKRKQKKR